MDRGLVVILNESDAERQLLAEAAEFSDCADAPLHVLRLISQREYDSAESPEISSDIDRTNYEEPATRQFIEETETFVSEAVREPTLTYEIDFEISEGGDRADTVMEAARDAGCDHIFLSGKQRSPTGKAIFGDLTQEVILNFDGVITLTMD
jgi:nucleotide-binding universal stress UspA family protein